MPKHTYRIWRWCVVLRTGGQATHWPWREITISRRTPTKRIKDV